MDPRGAEQFDEDLFFIALLCTSRIHASPVLWSRGCRVCLASQRLTRSLQQCPIPCWVLHRIASCVVLCVLFLACGALGLLHGLASARLKLGHNNVRLARLRRDLNNKHQQHFT